MQFINLLSHNNAKITIVRRHSRLNNPVLVASSQDLAGVTELEELEASASEDEIAAEAHRLVAERLHHLVDVAFRRVRLLCRRRPCHSKKCDGQPQARRLENGG